jgi:hypothetical protein
MSPGNISNNLDFFGVELKEKILTRLINVGQLRFYRVVIVAFYSLILVNMYILPTTTALISRVALFSCATNLDCPTDNLVALPRREFV